MDNEKLILNVTSGHKRIFKKPAIHGNRGQRIKQRKHLKNVTKSVHRKQTFQSFSEFDSGLPRIPSEESSIPDISHSRNTNDSRNAFQFNFKASDEKIRTPVQSNSKSSNIPAITNKLQSNKSASVQSKNAITLASASREKQQKTPKSSIQKTAVRSSAGYSDQDNGATDKLTVHKRVVSSLFNNNPLVPSIKCQDVETIKEDVFSNSSFKDLKLQNHLEKLLEERFGYSHMTCVQREAIPQIMSGRDVLVKSQTGSGKTLAYAVPIVQMLLAQPARVKRSDGVYTLVIVPTRELAQQTFNIFHQLVNACCWVVAGCLMGGENRKAEKARIRKGINILVATPGRLLDHLEHTGNMLLSNVKHFVIDEADRLLDLGFEMDISKIIQELSKTDSKKQTILLSATLSDRVEKLAGLTLHQPYRVHVSKFVDVCLTDDDRLKSFALPQKLRQMYVVVPAKLRLVTLSAFILSKLKFSKTPNKLLVFLSTQDSVSFHFDIFNKILLSSGTLPDTDSSTNAHKFGSNISLFSLYGDMPQKERSKVYKEFRAARSGLLLSTDVAARGLDLPHITWIVQYTTPGAAQDYIHRVGRTARIGTAGQALLFLLPSEVEYVEKLSTHHISLQSVDMKKILLPLKIYTNSMPEEMFTKRDKPRTTEESATYLQMQYERYIHKNPSAFDLATKAFLSFVRAYATYPGELKLIFRVRNLHLGHIAKSFALSETPTNLAASTSTKQNFKRKHDYRQNQPQSLEKCTAPAIISEFDSGLTDVNFKRRNIKKQKLNSQ